MSDDSASEPSVWNWPFTRSDLSAGLRRFLGDPSIRVDDVQPASMPFRRPAIGRVRGALVSFQTRRGSEQLSLVVKEPRGATRTSLAGAGRREVGVYQSLASQIPLRTPSLIAASPAGDWLVLDWVRSVREPRVWKPEDYARALENLAKLHDRFWGLSEDLEAYPWLGRPLDADFAVHVRAAAQAIQRIVQTGKPEPLATSPERMKVLARLSTQAEDVVRPLRRQPGTLLHGDYWPGNVAILDDGAQVVYDWQAASVGPAMCDLVGLVTKSLWWFGPSPIGPAEWVALYRQALLELGGHRWDEADWSLLWDHALMWAFLQEWVDLLAASPDALLAARAEQLEALWLDPVGRAVQERLPAL
jgi:hypothetical protein